MKTDQSPEELAQQSRQEGWLYQVLSKISTEGEHNISTICTGVGTGWEKVEAIANFTDEVIMFCEQMTEQ